MFFYSDKQVPPQKGELPLQTPPHGKLLLKEISLFYTAQLYFSPQVVTSLAVNKSITQLVVHVFRPTLSLMVTL